VRAHVSAWDERVRLECRSRVEAQETTKGKTTMSRISAIDPRYRHWNRQDPARWSQQGPRRHAKPVPRRGAVPGLGDAEILDVVANVALTTFTNYLNEVAKTEIDFPVVIHQARLANVEPLMNILAPPFTLATAVRKVRLAEDAWNSRDPERVSLAYSVDSRWRNRSAFIVGREAIRHFLEGKWARERDYRLIKEMWAFAEDRIAVRFAYEWHDEHGAWHRSYGNENWAFDPAGLMAIRHASINDIDIAESERLFHWPHGPRPETHPGLSDLGL
jgi:nuclear transport factor 2 (NTF2) superfamily protein